MSAAVRDLKGEDEPKARAAFRAHWNGADPTLDRM